MVLCVPTLLLINISLYDGKSNDLFFNESLIDIAEELLLGHMLRLPRIIYNGNERQKATGLSRLKCFIILLFNKDRLHVSLSNDDLIEKLLDVLLLSVEMERAQSLLEICGDVWQIGTENFAGSLFFGNKKSPWKIYKNIQNQQIINEIETVCEYLSKEQHVYTFVLELLYKMLLRNSNKSNEILVLIQMLYSEQHILNGTSSSLHKLIWENLLSDHHWNIITDTKEFQNVIINFKRSTIRNKEMNRKDDICDSFSYIKSEMNSLKEIKNNILHTCLIIETVSFYATQMRKEIYVMKSLYNIVEKSASKSYYIRASALLALESIRKAYNFNSISDLLDNNADYIIHKISKCLDKPSQLDAAIHILSNSLRFASTKTNVEAIIQLLIDADYAKKGQISDSLQYTYALKLILTTIHEIYESTIDSRNDEIDSMYNIGTMHVFYFNIWFKELNSKKVRHSYHKMENRKNQNKINLHPKDLRDDVHFELLEKLVPIILKQVFSQLTCKKRELKILVLDTINIGLDLIKINENELLPFVNLMWDILIQHCFQGNDKVLIQYCFRVITKLSKYVKEFVRKRFARYYCFIQNIDHQLISITLICVVNVVCFAVILFRA